MTRHYHLLVLLPKGSFFWGGDDIYSTLMPSVDLLSQQVERELQVQIAIRQCDTYIERLFHPDRKPSLTGLSGNLRGELDAHLDNLHWRGAWVMRQHSFEASKL